MTDHDEAIDRRIAKHLHNLLDRAQAELGVSSAAVGRTPSAFL
jgi:hypothetical protein